MEAEPPLFRVWGLTKRYSGRERRGAPTVEALAGIDLEVTRGSDLALVGQSGSGKSTLARCLARLDEPTSGRVLFEGMDLRELRGPRLLRFRERVQLILQDSATALDPRLTAAAIVSEPLEVLGRGDRRERGRQARELMDSVGLPAAWAARRPFELSGGQRQRLAIARALAVQPELLILDEAFAGLDASIQAQIATLLQELQARRGLTYLYVSHDLSLMALLADEVAIMFEGRIVERGEVGRIFTEPRHPHTRALIAAVASLPAPSAPPAS